MVECIFTIDYEIYGNGHGSLRDLVYEPAQRLKTVFDQTGAKFVVYVEAAELEQIAGVDSDPAIKKVQQQIVEFHQGGYEIALHLHPQWCNARYRGGTWELDYSEYNLCTLPRDRIEQIVDRSIAYLRRVLGDPSFTPLSFRAGNWLFQPTATAAEVLSSRGVKVDSSVFKGGLQHLHKLDYRPALRNGYCWRFQEDANIPECKGALVEVPIYTQMVPFWRMLTAKRVALQQKSNVAIHQTARNGSGRMSQLRDRLRLRYPLKFDFCRMTLQELQSMMERVIRQDQMNPLTYKPIVAIGHTKDLLDFDTIDKFLSYLARSRIAVTNFETVLKRLQSNHL